MIVVKSLTALASALAVLVLLAGERLPAAEAKQGWKAEWDRILEGAKKEGQMVLYAGADRIATFREFQKKYPDIKVVAVPGGQSLISQRVMSERRAGKYLADLYVSGSVLAYDFYQWKVLDPIRPALILPEVLDESKWWSGKHIYHDDESRYIFAFNGNVQSYFSQNTKLVNPKEFSSHWDFLNPKWKGKIVSMDPTMAGGMSEALSFFITIPNWVPTLSGAS